MQSANHSGISSYIKLRTNSQKLIAFTLSLDLNGEGDIKDLIEDGREFIA